VPLGATACLDNRPATGRTALRFCDVRAYALVELGDSEAIDLFLREEDAELALRDALRDEPA
jgi:hypothetical protein